MTIWKRTAIALPKPQINLNDRTNDTYFHGRNDIIWLYYHDVCNCFIDWNGSVQIDWFTGIVANKASEIEIRKACQAVYADMPEYVRAQVAWHTSDKYKQLMADHFAKYKKK